MKDSVMELLTRNPITEVPGIVKDYLGSFPHKADLPAVGGQGLSLLQCTKKEVIAAMLARGAYIIQGSEDCLVRDDINSLPGAELKVVPGKGHSKGANYRNRVRDVSDAIHLRAGLHAATLAIASL